MTSVHRGSATKARYARGAAVGRVTTTRTTRASGTSIRFRPDPRVFLHPRVSRAVLSQHLDDLSVLSPGLDVHGSFAGDALAAAGLAGRVAALIPCAIADVAHHRETYKTSRGPAAVEVALAWDRSFMPDRVDSFVNLQRTRDHGSHVDGMLDATKAFLASDTPGGLVGAVSVVLADVAWGTPTKNRLTTPEIRKPVAIATARALKAWERANPARAAAARGRRR